jgi:hypothetical protein
MQSASTVSVSPVHEDWVRRRQRLLVFVTLVGVYVSVHILFRWLFTLLFDSNRTWIGEYFGPKNQTLLESIYHIFMSALPIVFWCALIYAALARSRWLTHCSLAFLIAAWGMVFLEADMQWFRMSRQHITWADIHGFFSIDGINDIGLREADYARFYTMLFIHGGVLALCIPAAWLLCWLGAHRRLEFLVRRRTLTALVILMLADVIIVRHSGEDIDVEDISTPWRDLAQANPLRLRFLDEWYGGFTNRFSAKHHDLVAANAYLSTIAPGECPGAMHGIHVGGRSQFPADDVLVIAIESLNPDVFAETELPFLDEFSKKCLRLKNHYASGNGTHYGLLGLMYGTPITFYKGGLVTPLSCPYLDRFTARGYRSSAISTRLFGDGHLDAGGYHFLGDYVWNWTRPERIAECVRQTEDDWSIVPHFHRELAKPAPRFTFLFYLNTHFHYWHAPEYSKYQPEVDEDFNYNRSDLERYRPAIVNRYKNTLLEMDAWLKTVLDKVDLSRTIVVITGDHGEELLERGRIGHCMTLNRYQTMVPCLVHVPGVAAADVDFVTCHHDLMPSVADALGWKDRPGGLGQSIFQPAPVRYAVVAQQNWTERPVRWMIVTEDRKSIVDETRRDSLSIFSLLDLEGRTLPFADQPQRWRDNFRIIRKLEADLKR